MPNIKSAKKRVKVNQTKHDSNLGPKGSMKTAVKKTRKEANQNKIPNINWELLGGKGRLHCSSSPQ